MQRMFPTRSNERITSWESLNRYFAALSPSLGRGQDSARAVSPPDGESVVVDWTCSEAVTSDFITSSFTACADRFPHADVGRAWACTKSNKPALSRHCCFLPRKRCYPISPVKH